MWNFVEERMSILYIVVYYILEIEETAKLYIIKFIFKNKDISKVNEITLQVIEKTKYHEFRKVE